MRAHAVLFACVLFVLTARPLHAQTLVELLGPQLPAGKVDLGVALRGYGAEHWSIDVFEGTTTWFQPQAVLFPRAAIGLGRNVQLQVDVTNQLPITSVYQMTPGAASARDTPTTRAVSMGISYRPTRAVQLEVGMLLGRSRLEVSYPRTVETEAMYRATDTVRAFRFGWTWLPRPDRDSRPLRSDLDGLHRPVLGPNRWRIDGEVQWRTQSLRNRETAEGSADFLDERMDARLGRLRGGVAYGLAKGAQVAADVYWHPAFSAAQSTNALNTFHGVPFPMSRAFSDRYHHLFGVRLGGTWRREELEATVAASREHQQVGSDWFRTSTVRAAATWIWRKPRTTLERTGLAGFDRPLLERGQAALDALGVFRSHDENLAAFDMDLRAWRAGISFGLTTSLEIAAHAGIVYSKHLLSGGGYLHHPASGADLTLRLAPGVQFFATGGLYRVEAADDYPLFVLGVNDPFHNYRRFTDSELSGGRNASAGVRVIW